MQKEKRLPTKKIGNNTQTQQFIIAAGASELKQLTNLNGILTITAIVVVVVVVCSSNINNGVDGQNLDILYLRVHVSMYSQNSIAIEAITIHRFESIANVHISIIKFALLYANNKL